MAKERYYARNWASFHFMGNINNFSYCVVNAAGQSLAEFFHNSKNIGLILWANIAFGFVARMLNTFVLEKISTRAKITFNVVIMATGLVGVAMSVYVNFWFCLACISLIGIGSSFGESVLLVYLKQFPSEMVNGWSSGTGVAGVSGSLFYIALSGLAHLENQTIFLIILPTIAIYGLLFFLGIKIPRTKTDALLSEDTPLHYEELNEELVNTANDDQGQIPTQDDMDSMIRPEVGPPGETKKQRYIRCARLVWWNAINLMLVYFFEYVASVGGADLAVRSLKGDWFNENAYPILSFCYQFGVLLSRSSLQLVKIKRIGVITVLQGINMALWLLQGRYKMISSIWVLFVLMFYCGLLGGASYVNVFYLILHDKRIPNEDREVCINYAALLVTLGITLASVFILVMDHTFMKAYLPVTTDSSSGESSLLMSLNI
ncbi:hypothetical protein SAMD00019534_084140, partial [Acytostelium subglobosum LB1]|uniref:hypothetical protein n=1 Tax=Acytostelium subglobosum LB1 TaxID=1410327 RepID=UPI000644C0DD